MWDRVIVIDWEVMFAVVLLLVVLSCGLSSRESDDRGTD